jgi:thioredoxin reductase
MDHDVVILGGGPAGLQAALTLGRMHRRVLVLDPGGYRNDPAHHLHNFLSRDGTAPAELRAVAREQLAEYGTVEVRDVGAAEVATDGEGFVVRPAGGDPVSSRRLLLATGVRDVLPDVPGLAELFGSVAAHCPYCHGHEFSGQHVGVLGSGPHVARVAMLVSRIASRTTVLADGGELDEATRDVLARAGVTVRPERVLGVCPSAVGARVDLESGPVEEVGGLFVAPAFAQAAPFAEQLGLDLLPSGCVEVGTMGQTSRPGVYAAGDMAHQAVYPMPLASVLTAAASGLLAGTGVDSELMALDSGLVPPG